MPDTVGRMSRAENDGTAIGSTVVAPTQPPATSTAWQYASAIVRSLPRRYATIADSSFSSAVCCPGGPHTHTHDVTHTQHAATLRSILRWHDHRFADKAALGTVPGNARARLSLARTSIATKLQRRDRVMADDVVAFAGHVWTLCSPLSPVDAQRRSQAFLEQLQGSPAALHVCAAVLRGSFAGVPADHVALVQYFAAQVRRCQ